MLHACTFIMQRHIICRIYYFSIISGGLDVAMAGFDRREVALLAWKMMIFNLKYVMTYFYIFILALRVSMRGRITLQICLLDFNRDDTRLPHADAHLFSREKAMDDRIFVYRHRDHFRFRQYLPSYLRNARSHGSSNKIKLFDA